MQIINHEFEKALPCVEINSADQQSDWSSDFEVDFENEKQEMFKLKGTVSCDIIDETDESGEDNRPFFYLSNFTFAHLNVIVNDDFTHATSDEVDLMKYEIENYITNKFEE